MNDAAILGARFVLHGYGVQVSMSLEEETWAMWTLRKNNEHTKAFQIAVLFPLPMFP